jgi:hypothetical protein
MSAPTIFSVKSSILDRERELVLDNEFLAFDDKDRIGALPARILKQDITAYRFGVKWIRGYSFVIGRVYCIDIKSVSGEVIKLRLKSVYGINKKQLTDKYSRILNALHDQYFDDLIRQYLRKHTDLQDFDILGIIFRQDGVLIDQKSKLIPWEDLGTKSYSTYYAVFAKSDPAIYKAFEYLNDWNTGVLYSVSREILKSKSLYSEA